MEPAALNDRGFTGLEAAIVLIAFVVVAAVFSFTVLGAGFFTTQKSQEVVHAGLQQAKTSLSLGGTVIAKIDFPDPKMKRVCVDLQLNPGGGAVDMTGVSYTISTSERVATLTANDPRVELTWRYRQDDDNLLERDELASVDITVLDYSIRAGETFAIEVKSSEGAVLEVKRTVPAGLTPNDYCELLP